MIKILQSGVDNAALKMSLPFSFLFYSLPFYLTEPVLSIVTCQLLLFFGWRISHSDRTNSSNFSTQFISEQITQNSLSLSVSSLSRMESTFTICIRFPDLQNTSHDPGLMTFIYAKEAEAGVWSIVNCWLSSCVSCPRCLCRDMWHQSEQGRARRSQRLSKDCVPTRETDQLWPFSQKLQIVLNCGKVSKTS